MDAITAWGSPHILSTPSMFYVNWLLGMEWPMPSVIIYDAKSILPHTKGTFLHDSYPGNFVQQGHMLMGILRRTSQEYPRVIVGMWCGYLCVWGILGDICHLSMSVCPLHLVG